MDKYWEGYDKEKAKPLCKLKNWAVRGQPNPYQAPEATPTILEGNVYHHPKLKDGDLIYTSPIIGSLDNIVETRNSYYELEEPDVTYTLWCEAKGITIDPENPIRIK